MMVDATLALGAAEARASTYETTRVSDELHAYGWPRERVVKFVIEQMVSVPMQRK